ncbi:MAG: serine/threonine protein kinase, partial [Proteobacteria bacterium]|nr:serine/threonine protein kinase [Pseudomonadota bacterium]
IGQYYIMEKVAQGGMAEIYRGLAYDVHGISQREVCIKKILPHLSADREFIGSLIDEAKLAVRLVHGNIAQTYDLGKVGDDYYMVMEYVEGATISQINKRCIARGTLVPIPIAVYLASEVAAGIDYMHRRTDDSGVPLHIVHRDISPQNIMVSFSGTVKIIDFGIAKPAFKASGTDSGLLKGKFAYMSPEQAMGEPLDHRSDIFSLGIILHEILSGRRLFKAEDSRETIRNVRKALVEPLVNTRPEIPDELDRVVMKALTKDRRHRHPFASELRDELVKFLHKHYPDFLSSDVANFVQELFKDEMGRARPLEADSRTPALIIDRTNSALAGDEQFEVTGVARAPANIKEFMLEEESESGTPPPAEGAQPAETGGEETTGSRPPPDLEPPRPRRRAGAKWLAPLAVALAVAAWGSFRLYLHLSADHAVAPEAGAASAIVVTDPADAEVALDGKAAGRGSPVTIRGISPDQDHTISVTKEGFLPHSEPLSLGRGEFRSVSVSLKPAAAPAADLELISTPPGAVVYLDDKETQHRTPVTMKRLDAGRPHVVGLYLQGYKFWTKEIRLEAGQSKSFEVALVKDLGSLLVDSQPQGAIVVIDGAPVGTTPVTKLDLDPEKVHAVEIWHEGYRPEKREFKPTAGAHRDMRVILTPVPAHEQPSEE